MMTIVMMITIHGKISAQPHTTLCIQFLDRENNDKNNRLPLGKQIQITIAWGCAEILPNSYLLANDAARLLIGIFATANLITCISYHIVVCKCSMYVHLGKSFSNNSSTNISRGAVFYNLSRKSLNKSIWVLALKGFLAVMITHVSFVLRNSIKKRSISIC